MFWGAQESRINQEESLEIACVGIVCFFSSSFLLQWKLLIMVGL
jgi:hypothetical protein